MKQNSVNCNAVNNSVTLKVQYHQWQKNKFMVAIVCHSIIFLSS